MKPRIKINAVIIFCAVLLIAIFPNTFFRSKHASFLGIFLDILGLAFILLGQILRVSARGFKSDNSANGHLLIKGGPYILVRNPMYLGILLIGLGIVNMLFQWWASCIFLSVFIIRYVSLIFKEEQRLLAAFSKDYLDYCNRVPRILPSVAMMYKMDISEYLPLKLSWIKKEISSISAVLLITFILNSWRGSRNEGLGVYLKEAVVISVTIILFVGLVIYLSKRAAFLKTYVSNKG